jgi:osmotically-inducible protein OsmY
MLNQNQNLRPIPAAAAAIAGANDATASARTSQEVTEARQETQIWTTFALSPYLRANDIKVSVREGKATLTGNVADGVNKDMATQIALGVNGIKAVDNNIEVQPNYMPTQPAERAFGEVVEDAAITSAVRSKISWSRYGEGLSANVDTTRGRVSLSGTANSSEAREFATKLAQNTKGVRSVDNQLMLGFAKPEAAKTEGTDFADGWITMKVKATFMHSTHVDSSDISVSTNDGIVKLTGKLKNDSGRASAIELASHVRGVKSVDSSSLTM